MYSIYFPRVGGGEWVVGKCVSKENHKSDLDLDLGFVNSLRKESIYLQILVLQIKDCL